MVLSLENLLSQSKPYLFQSKMYFFGRNIYFFSPNGTFSVEDLTFSAHCRTVSVEKLYFFCPNGTFSATNFTFSVQTVIVSVQNVLFGRKLYIRLLLEFLFPSVPVSLLNNTSFSVFNMIQLLLIIETDGLLSILTISTWLLQIKKLYFDSALISCLEYI